MTLVDTAGVRDTLDVVEREGVARGDRARSVADLVLSVLDASDALTDDDDAIADGDDNASAGSWCLNKIDLATESVTAPGGEVRQRLESTGIDARTIVPISAATSTRTR